MLVLEAHGVSVFDDRTRGVAADLDLGLAQRIAQKLARVAPAACEAPPGPVSMAPQLQP